MTTYAQYLAQAESDIASGKRKQAAKNDWETNIYDTGKNYCYNCVADEIYRLGTLQHEKQDAAAKINAQELLGYDEINAIERARIIEYAEGINQQAVTEDLSMSSKFEKIAAQDRPFAAALLVIANNGDADYEYADGSSRIGWHIVGEDDNSFVWYETEDGEESTKHKEMDEKKEFDRIQD